MAKTLHKENKTLQQEVKTLKADYKTLEETATENEKQMKKLMKDYKTKTKAEIAEMKEKMEEQADDLEKTKHFISRCAELSGKETADEVLEWVDKKATEDQAEKTQQDALRMLGELQVKFNLLTEEMEKHKEKTLNTNKKQKGLSGQHRKEDCANGNLRPFVPCRCSAISWANGLAQQCSRHWDKHEDGKTSHLCATHHKLLCETEDGRMVYTGSWGLYHQPRPDNWGQYGLKVQNEWAKRVDKPIPYKLKKADYDAQFAQMASEVADDVPRFDYPELKMEAVVEQKELAEFSSDEEDEDNDQQTIAFSDSDGGNDVADLNDVADVETPEGTDEEVVETEVVDEDPVAFAKQAQLDRLEELNKGAMAVDYDILCDLREEKAEWEEEQKMKMTHEEAQGKESTDEEDEEFECYNCSKQFPVASAHYPFEHDEPWCFDCQRDELDAQKYESNCLKGSDDSDEDE